MSGLSEKSKVVSTAISVGYSRPPAMLTKMKKKMKYAPWSFCDKMVKITLNLANDPILDIVEVSTIRKWDLAKGDYQKLSLKFTIFGIFRGFHVYIPRFIFLI